MDSSEDPFGTHKSNRIHERTHLFIWSFPGDIYACKQCLLVVFLKLHCKQLATDVEVSH